MNRRQFLLPLHARNAGTTPKPLPFSTTPSLAPYRGDWNRTTAAHLLRRALCWPTAGELRAAETARLDDLVVTLTTDSPTLPEPPPYVALWADDPIAYFNGERVDLVRTFFEELCRWWVVQMVEGEFTIRERLTLFWHSHFATSAMLVDDQRYTYLQNQLFRRYALGNFRLFVRGVTADKGMLQFLNGRQNKRGAINENYARELLELFTLGNTDNNREANYTQADVTAAAHILSGYDWVGTGSSGAVRCDYDTGHDLSDKFFFGEMVRGNLAGVIELDHLLDLIFGHPEASRYVIRKLYRFFVYTDALLTPVMPMASEIEKNIIVPLAEEFRDSGWNIATVLRRLLASEHFYDPAVIGSSLRSPVDLLAGSVRGMRAEQGSRYDPWMTAQEIHLNAEMLGQALFVPPGVQGWAAYRSWISTSTLPQRHRYTDRLIDGFGTFVLEVRGNRENEPVNVAGNSGVDVLGYARQWQGFDDDPDDLIDGIAGHLLAYPASARLRARLLEALMQGQPGYEWRSFPDDLKHTRLRAMLKLLMRSANYQLM